MGQINTITINDEEYKINFMAGGDLKWISLVFEINAANSKFPCPFCKWKNEEIKLLTYDEKQNKPKNEVLEIEKKIINKLFDKNKNIRRKQDESMLLKDRQNSEQIYCIYFYVFQIAY